MKFDFKRLTIKQQLLGIFCLFVLLAAINFLVINYFIDATTVARQKAEVATQLRSSVNTVKNQFKDLEGSNEEAKKVVHRAANKTTTILETFDEGGLIPQFSLEIEPVKGESRKYIDHTIQLWDSLQVSLTTLRFEPYYIDTTIQEVQEIPNYDSLNTTRTEVVSKIVSVDNPVVVKAKAFFEDNIDDFNERVMLFVAQIEENNNTSEDKLGTAILIVVFINLVLVSLILLAVRKLILVQIEMLDDLVEQLNHGYFDVRKDFRWKNEVSKVAEKINNLALGLKNATDFVKQVGKGELNAEFKGLDTENVNENSLESALINMRDQMKQVEEEEETRNWTTGGLTKFVDILRSTNDNVAELSDKIISNLVEYTHSNQGGLYLLNDDDSDNQYLELMSLYAFNTKKYDQKSYRLGEGLVGQTFLERKTTYLLEIPDDYITITSGLGGSKPKAILIVPLQVNEDIFGILELASFEEYKEYEIEFVEKLGESIASTIASVRNNQKTKKLLEDSQELTEQMQAQEEEMRQNMEELSATQEEMARKEIEITAQLTAINNSVGTLEYDNEGNITHVNAIFCEKMGYKSEDLVERGFGVIYRDGRNIWPSLISGNRQDGEYVFKKGNEDEVILETSFTPIKNDNGEVYKVIQLVTQFGVQEVLDAPAPESHIDEVEQALRQNLEELEITQEQLNKQLQHAQLRFSAINKHVKIITISEALNIIDINEAAVQALGKSLQELKNSSVNDLFRDDLIKAIKDKKSESVLTLKGDDGHTIESQGHLIFEADESNKSSIIVVLWV
ncbi:MAG: GAF domain-containing protein [Fulvivirga sp.]